MPAAEHDIPPHMQLVTNPLSHCSTNPIVDVTTNMADFSNHIQSASLPHQSLGELQWHLEDLTAQVAAMKLATGTPSALPPSTFQGHGSHPMWPTGCSYVPLITELQPLHLNWH